TKVACAPAARVSGPGGTGPDWIVVRPGTVYTVAVTPVTGAPPAFVTVRLTANHCPAETTAGAAAAESRAPAVVIVARFDAATPLASAPPVFPSLPVTVVENNAVPADVTKYVHARFAEAPPARTGIVAGLDTSETPPVPSVRRFGTTLLTDSASAWPVFVTVRVTVRVWFSHSGVGWAVSGLATSTAGVWIRTAPEVTGPVVSAAPELASVPVAVVVNRTFPGTDP